MKHPRHIRALAGLLILALMTGTVLITRWLQSPPSPKPHTAAETVFSAERAMHHIKVIASVRNPVGSPENGFVRNYICLELEKLGTEYHLQELFYYLPEQQRGAQVSNIVARIPGKSASLSLIAADAGKAKPIDGTNEPADQSSEGSPVAQGKSILFMGHYDTVVDARGAADNGSAVASMLELIRLLQLHPPLEHDLVFLFSDAEEVGLIGAEAFLGKHPWARHIDLVINLESRGTSGQSLMFETSENNLALIRSFSGIVPYPAANSLSYEIYARMPNYTDFNPFKFAGYPGLNFAFIEQGFDYHTGGDRNENLNLRSVQHHGSYIESLALSLGNDPLRLEAAESAVYFNTLGYGFIAYPYSRVISIALFTLAVSLLILVLGFRRGLLEIISLLKATASLLLFLAGTYWIIHIAYLSFLNLFPGKQALLLSYNQTMLMGGFGALTMFLALGFFYIASRGLRLWLAGLVWLAVLALMILAKTLNIYTILATLGGSALLFGLLRKPLSMHSLAAGGLIIWLKVMLAVSFIVPGGSYLFVWPLLFALIPIGVFYLARWKRAEKPITIGLAFLFALPVLAWFPSLSILFAEAMGLPMIAIAWTITALGFGLLMPLIERIMRYEPWLPLSITGLIALVVLVWLWSGSDFSERHKWPNNLMLASDGLTAETWYVSQDRQTDAFTAQFLGEDPQLLSMNAFYPGQLQSYAARLTSIAALPAPSARLVHDTIVDDHRYLSIHLQSNRQAAWLNLYMKSDADSLMIRIAGSEWHRLKSSSSNPWGIIRFFALTHDGIELEIQMPAEKELQVRLTDYAFDMDQHTGNLARPAHMMSRGDRSLAHMAFVF